MIIAENIDLAIGLCDKQIDSRSDRFARPWKSVRQTLNEAKAEIEKQSLEIEEALTEINSLNCALEQLSDE